jgi:metal-responsive CopG/Arc/MetJ family transcriptional regulator
MENFEQWVHVKITDKSLAEKLDKMSAEDMRDRSKFFRWLIQQEWNRRYPQMAHVVGEESIVQLDVIADGKKLLNALKLQPVKKSRKAVKA